MELSFHCDVAGTTNFQISLRNNTGTYYTNSLIDVKVDKVVSGCTKKEKLYYSITHVATAVKANSQFFALKSHLVLDLVLMVGPGLLSCFGSRSLTALCSMVQRLTVWQHFTRTVQWQ